MAGLTKKMRIHRLDKAISKLEKLGTPDLPRRLAARIVADINASGQMEKIIIRRFRSRSTHGPGSQKWARRKRKYTWPILDKTGILMADAAAGVVGTFKLKGPIKFDLDKVFVEYAPYHQHGTGRMVARPFYLPPSKQELTPAMRMAARIVKSELKKLARVD